MIGGSLTGTSAKVQNIGAASAGTFQIEYYLAQHPNVTTSDIDTTWGCTVTNGLAAGATWTCSGTIGIPSGLSPGVYYLAAIADSAGVIAESNKTNNMRVNDNGPITLTAAGQSCTFSLGSSSANIGAAGGTGTISVVTTNGCSWTATTSASWVHITSGASGSGLGTVGYSVDFNNASARSGPF